MCPNLEEDAAKDAHSRHGIQFSGIKFKEYRFEDNDQSSLLDFLNSNFNHMGVEYWNWKFKRNPNGDPIIWVAKDADKIVGCYILNPVRIRLGAISVLGAQSVDAAVDSAYRGAGIFKRLGTNALKQAFREDITIIYAFPNRFAHKGQVSIGYKPAFIVPKMYKIMNLRIFDGSGNLGGFFQKAPNILRFSERSGRIRLQNMFKEKLAIRKIRYFDSRFEVFWRTICEHNTNILVERSLDYLQWRYFENPEQRYSVHICEENNGIVGYSVHSIKKELFKQKYLNADLSMGNIVDFLTLPNKSYAGLRLVAHMLDHFELEQVDIASCWMLKNHPYHEILSRFGFSEYYELLRRLVVHPKYVSQFIVFINSRAAERQASEFQLVNTRLGWYIMHGDLDTA